MTDEPRGGNSKEEADDQPRAVALVILRAPKGTSAQNDSTEAPVQDPVRGTGSEASQAMAKAGFSVGPIVGTSFSIEGSPQQFLDLFGAAPVRSPDGTWLLEGGIDELPLDTLDTLLLEKIKAVVFERPAELHPFSDS